MVTEENTNEGSEEAIEEIQEAEHGSDSSDQGEVDVPAYEPNYAYKVYDEEREMDEWIRSLIKDKDTEENVRGLLSKAGGFDHLKGQYGSLKDEYGQVATQYNGVADRIEELDYLMKNSPALFFKEIGLSDDQVIRYVQDLLAQKDMSPQELARVQAQNNSLLTSYQTGRRADQLESQNYQLAKNSMQISVDQALSAPEVSELQRSFDANMGQGAFRREVEAQGWQFHQTNGYDTTGPDAVRMAFEKWKPLIANKSVGQTQGTSVAKPKGHIPNVGSGDATASPTKPRFKDIDALKKYARELEQTGS